jgi:hypothetical protein
MWIDKERPNELKDTVSATQAVGAGAGGPADPTSQTGGNSPNTNPTTTPQTTQKFATVQDYLKTNQPQSEDLGQKFNTQLDTTFGKETGAIDTAANQTKNDINAGATNYNADLINKAKSDPASVANDANQYDAFNKQWNASYAGPQSFEQSNNYGEATGAVNEANQIKGQLGTVGGREQLIQDQFNVYGAGNKGLDQALLQNSSQFGKVQDQEKKFGTVQDYLNQQAKAVNPLAAKAASDTAAAQTSTRNAFTNSLSDFKGDIASKVAEAQAIPIGLQNKLKNDFVSGNAGKALQSLIDSGVSPEQAQTIASYLQSLNNQYNSNPEVTNFLTNPSTDITSANVALQSDYDKAAALQKLTGVDFGGVLNPSDAAKAGTANKDVIKNPVDLSNYLKNELGKRDTEIINKGTVSDVFSSLGLQDIMDATNAWDPASGAKGANALISAANRTGGQSALDTLKKLQKEAEVKYNYLYLMAPGPKDPQIRSNNLAGLSYFVRTLGGATGEPVSLRDGNSTPITQEPNKPITPSDGLYHAQPVKSSQPTAPTSQPTPVEPVPQVNPGVTAPTTQPSTKLPTPPAEINSLKDLNKYLKSIQR